MAVVMTGVGTATTGAAAASMACSSRPLQGGAVCCSQVTLAAAPMRVSNGSSSTNSRSVLPACWGLKVDCSGMAKRKIVGTSFVRSSKVSKGVVCEAQETAVGTTGVVSDQTFQSLVLESDVTVLVDFWAPWCGPCRMIAPLIDELARIYGSKLRCLKLNTDESPFTATEYGIRSIPTVMIFKSGQKKDTVIGAVPISTLTATVDKYLD